MEDLMLDFAKTLAETLTKKTKQEIKNKELLAFANNLETQKNKIENLVEKADKTFNKDEFMNFAMTCSVFVTSMDVALHKYISKTMDAKRAEFRVKGGKKHGK